MSMSIDTFEHPGRGRTMWNGYSNVEPRFYSSTTTTYTTSYGFPVALVVGLVGGLGLLVCLTVVCCACRRRKTKGRVIQAPSAATTLTPASPSYLHEQHNPLGYNASSAGGPALLHVPTPDQPAGDGIHLAMAPSGYPVLAPYTNTVTREPPPAYDSDRLVMGGAGGAAGAGDGGFKPLRVKF